jgi:putative regulatory protein, alpha family;|uniref:Putative transcriptional regulator n=1 Tax=Phage sp. ctHEp8 TaxID=2825790 RepID=A0A8S5TXX7_9VIRU|nr:MAG TPA: putative transcriptional regulator [Phage sp. ctHEp8]
MKNENLELQNENLQQKLISGADACRIVGFGRTKLNELVKAKKFPQPISFSQNFVRWDLEEVHQWIEEQKAAR